MEYINSLKVTLDIIPTLNDGTEVFKFLSSLNEKTSTEELLTLAFFSGIEISSLEKKEQELHSLNKTLLTTEISILNKQITELDNLVSKITSNQRVPVLDIKNEIALTLQDIERLKKQEAKGIQDIAERRGIQFYDSPEFRAFLVAAESYIEQLDNIDYPTENDVCIYCRQPFLESDSILLLKQYRELLNDTTQSDLKTLSSKIETLTTRIQELTDILSLHQSSFGEKADGTAHQPDDLVMYARRITEIKKVLQSRNLSMIMPLDVEVEDNLVISTLKTRSEELSSLKAMKSTLLQELEVRELQLKKEIADLKDRRTLNYHVESVKQVIDNLKLSKFLSELSSQFNTNALSRKTTAARSALLESNFREIFAQELRHFKRSNFEINLSFQTDKGISVISQLIRDKHSLSDVLSEGEQKAIALAEFISELRLEENNAPVVFDDPVTSLDHHIIDQIARRLIELSRNRQVVIFTHSILFFNSLKQKSDLATYKGIEFKFYETTKDSNVTGILLESPTVKEDNFKHYKNKIISILTISRAIEGYNNLRSSIEVLVESDLLKATVKRYRKNVALSSLEKINGNFIDQHKVELSEIFERCCLYTDAHSNTEELIRTPNLDELKIDFERVSEIRASILK